LHCYRREANGIETRIGVYLKRSLDTYFRHSPHKVAIPGVLPSSLPRPIFLTSISDENTIKLKADVDNAHRISIILEDSHPYQVDNIKAVPETYWHTNEQFFFTHGLSRFKGFVRFRVTSRIPSDIPIYETSTEERSQVILFCDLLGRSDLRVSLYAETGLQSSPKPAEFIDPFRNIEQYGPLGDPFSLEVLSPGEQEDRRVSILHRDHRHDYVVTTRVVMTQPAVFKVFVKIISQNDPQMDPRWGLGHGLGRLELGDGEPKDDRHRAAYSTAR
jgi:hypothetical protein